MSAFLSPRWRILDCCFMLFAAAAITVPAIFIYGQGGGAELVIEGDEGQRWRFPVDATQTLEVKGPLGNTKIEISDGSAKILDSPCENKSCVFMGRISRAGAWSACLPNKVLLTIEGGAKNGATGGIGEPDAVSW